MATTETDVAIVGAGAAGSVFAALLAEAGKQDQVVIVLEVELRGADVAGARTLQVGDIDEGETNDALFKVDVIGLQPGLVLRRTEMGHPQVVPISVINAGHGGAFRTAAEVLHDRGSATCQKEGDARGVDLGRFVGPILHT